MTLARLLRSVRIDRLLFGPIFLKEMLVSGRRRSSHFTRLGYGILLALVTWITIWMLSSEMNQISASNRLALIGEVGPNLASTVLWLQFVILPLIAISMTASAISDERQNRTLESMLASPLKPAQIVFGKLTSSMANLLILGIMSIPMLLALRTLGGIETRFVFAATAITLCTCLLAGSIALWLSAYMRRAWQVFLSTLVLMVVLQFWWAIILLALRAIDLSIGSSIVGSGSGVLDWVMIAGLLSSTPLAFLAEFVRTQAPVGLIPTAMPVWLAKNGLIITCVVCLLQTSGFAGLAIRRIRKTAGGTPASTAKNVQRMQGEVDHTSAPQAPRQPLPEDLSPKVRRRLQRAHAERSRASRRVSDHPFLWRLVRRSGMENPILRWTVRILIAIIVLFIYLNIVISSDMQSGTSLLCVIIPILTMFIAASATTGSFAVEREGRTWDVLLTTPITASALVFQNSLAGFLRSSWPLVIIIIQILLLMTVEVFRIDLTQAFLRPCLLLLHVIPVTLAWAAALSATGTFLATICKRQNTATSCNLAIWLSLWLIIPLLSMPVLSIILDDEGSLLGIYLFFNPIVVSAVAGFNFKMIGTLEYDWFWLDGVSPAGYTILALASAATGIIVAGAVHALTSSIMRRRTLRIH